MILMIDNYDSFTYNLVQMLQVIGENVHVWRNDKIDIAGIENLRPCALVISPGPGTPAQAARVEGLESVSWVGVFHLAYKLSPDLVRDGT